MLKAAALNLAMVVALIITVLLGSLIYLYSFFRNEQQKIERWHHLDHELEAASQLALSLHFPYTEKDSTILSPINLADSIRISKRKWGFLDFITLLSWRNTDSLKRGFLTGRPYLDPTVLYTVDEDRPLSISGKTVITGDVFIPAAGLRPSFVDGSYYQGIKELVTGTIKNSTNSLPDYDRSRIVIIHKLYDQAITTAYLPIPHVAHLANSFFEPTVHYQHFQKGLLPIDSVSGNLVIMSDSAVTLTQHNYWKDALLIAPFITIEDGFTGKGQFFALDSLRVGKDVKLNYPSLVAVLTAEKSNNIHKKLSIGERTHLKGLALMHRDKVGSQMDILELGKHVKVDGEIISFGLLKYSAPIQVNGAIYSYRFVTQRTSSLYENYLIDLSIERDKLQPYFLRSYFWAPIKKPQHAILQWLD